MYYNSQISKCFYLEGFEGNIKDGTFKISKKNSGEKPSLVYQEPKKGKTVLPLQKISKEDLLNIRTLGIPGFVLKLEKTLFYTQISKDFPQIAKLEGFLENHECRDCKKLGTYDCSKTSDGALSFVLRYRSKDFKKAVKISQRIEKYDYITYGFETFNVTYESFVVFNCKNVEKSTTKKSRISDESFRKSKEKLATYFDPDFVPVMDLGMFVKNH